MLSLPLTPIAGRSAQSMPAHASAHSPIPCGGPRSIISSAWASARRIWKLAATTYRRWALSRN